MDDVIIFGLTGEQLIGRAVVLTVAVVVAVVISHVLSRVLRKFLDKSSVPSASIFVNILRVVIWAFALLSVLQPVFGVQPTAFVTALGVTSLALSLGLQDTISNVIGGLSLMLSHVLKPGDGVTVGSFSGEVVDINWRSTTVRDRIGNQHVIPNSVLSKTAFTKLTPASGCSCELDLVVRRDANLVDVEADIMSTAVEALGDAMAPGMPPLVRFVGASPIGVTCAVFLYAADGCSFSLVKDRVVRALSGRDWLVDEQLPAADPAIATQLQTASAPAPKES